MSAGVVAAGAEAVVLVFRSMGGADVVAAGAEAVVFVFMSMGGADGVPACAGEAVVDGGVSVDEVPETGDIAPVL